MFFRAVVAAGKRQDQGIVTLDFAELARCARVIGQLSNQEEWRPGTMSERMKDSFQEASR